MTALNRQAVEAIHREMMKASIEAAGHDRRLQDHQARGHGLEPVLRTWVDAARKLRNDVAASKDKLVKDGSEAALIERVLQRLEDLEGRAKDLDVNRELDDTVRSWQGLAQEFAGLRGLRAIYLVSALQSRQSDVDRATRELSAARAAGGVAPPLARERRELQLARDGARRRYEELRQRYLLAEREYAEGARQQGEGAQPAVREFVLPGGLRLAAVPPGAAKGSPGRPAPLVLELPKQLLPKPPAVKVQGGPTQVQGKVGVAPAVHGKQSLARDGLALATAASAGRQGTPGGPNARVGLPPPDGGGVLSPSGGRVTAVDGWRELGRGADGVGQGSVTVLVKIAGGGAVAEPQATVARTFDLGCGARFSVRTGLQWNGGKRPRDAGILTLALSASGGRLGNVHPDAARQRADQAVRQVDAWLRSELSELGPAVAGRAAAVAAEAASTVFAGAVARPLAPAPAPGHLAQPGAKLPIPPRPGFALPRPPALGMPRSLLAGGAHTPALPGIRPAVLAPKAAPGAPAPGAARLHRGRFSVPPRRLGARGGFSPRAGSLPVGTVREQIHLGPDHGLRASDFSPFTVEVGGGFLSVAVKTVEHGLEVAITSSGGALSAGERAVADALARARDRGIMAGAPAGAEAARHIGGAVADAVRLLLPHVTGARPATGRPQRPGVGVSPPGIRPPAPSGATQHHVQKLNAAFAAALETARTYGHGGATKAAELMTPLERDGVADRLQKTIGSLSLATGRALVDVQGGALRTGLAQVDALIGKLQGKRGAELAQGAEELSHLLGQIGTAAGGSAQHLGAFRKLLQERKGKLSEIAGKVAGGVRGALGAAAGKWTTPGAGGPVPLPYPNLAGLSLDQIKKLYPGLEKMLKGAATADLGKQLGKLAGLPVAALGRAAAVPSSALGKAAKLLEKGLSGAGTSMFGKLGGVHLGGLGTGHLVGGLGSFVSGGLAKAISAGVKDGKGGAAKASRDVGKVLAAFQKSGHEGALHEMGKLAEKQQKKVAARLKHKNHAAITADALSEAFHDAGKSDFAQHLKKGGALHGILDAAQRQHGKGLGAITSHLLNTAGHQKLSSALGLVEGLVKQGHKPRFSLWGSITGAVSKAASSIGSAVSSTVAQASSIVQATAGAVGRGVSSVVNTATNVAQRVGGAVGNVVQRAAGVVGRVASRVGSAVSGVAGRVSGAVRGAYDRVSSAAHSIYDRASSAVHDVADRVSTAAHSVYDRASGIAHSVYDRASGIAHGVADRVSGVAHDLYDRASGVVRRAGSAIHSGLDAASGWVSQTARRVAQAAGGAWSSVKGVAGQMWDSAKGVAGQVWGAAKGVAGQAWDAAKSAGGQVWDAAKGTWSAVKGVAGSAWDAAKSVGGQVWDAAKGTWSLVKGAAGQAWDAAKGVGGQVWDAAKGAWSTVKGLAGSAIDRARQFGGQIASGVQQGASWLWDKASSLGQAAMGGIQKGWGALQGVAGRVASGVTGMAQSAWNWAGNKVGSIWGGIKSVGSSIWGGLKSAGGAVWGGLKSAGGAVWGGLKSAGGAVWGGLKAAGGAAWDAAKAAGGAIKSVGGSIWDDLKGAGSWVVDKAKGAAAWAADKAKGAGSWIGEKVKGGLEWANKTGIVGALGTGLKKGLSFLGKAAEFTPLGLAMKAGKSAGDWFKGGGLGKLWEGTKNLAGKAWEGIKTGYKAASGFLQSPAGQLLVTGLSLAASFVPGGMLVKGLVGGAIGAITAISEGKDWKGILAGGVGGALTGALPFMKIGPLGKMVAGAVTGGVSALASGGGLKDVLKGAAGGAVDSFDPGALKALKRFKSVSAVEKLVTGKGLSALEKTATSKGPLKLLEKVMTNSKVRGTISALEKTGSKVVKGGIWVSGKAAKAQELLDKALSMGDKLSGALGQVAQYAPEMSNLVGDNAIGRFITRIGDYAGKGQEKLQGALDYGHSASDKMGEYRGYLDKGLGWAGVKDPAKAYEKMMARRGAAKGDKGAIAAVAQQKLEKHRARTGGKVGIEALQPAGGSSSPVHSAHGHEPGTLKDMVSSHSSGRRGRAADRGDEAPRTAREPRGKKRGGAGEHEGESHDGAPKKGKRRGHPDAGGGGHAEYEAKTTRSRGGKGRKSLLEQAIAKGKELQKRGTEIVNKVDKRVGQLHDIVGKGLEGAQRIQGGLEKASELAEKGAELLGEDNELGKYLRQVHEKAEQVHGYLETGIGYAESFNSKLEKGQELLHKIPGVGEHGEDEGGESEGGESGGGKKKRRGKKKKGPGDQSPLEEATHLDGGKGRRKGGGGAAVDGTPQHRGHPEAKEPANETPEQRTKRGQEAWNKIGFISGAVQRYETDYKAGLVKIHRLLAEGKSGEASRLLMDLGTECDSLNGQIRDAKGKAAGFESYEKELKFYEGWHKQAKEKIYAAIAETKGIGDHAAISGFGFDAKSHPDIFKNNAQIFGVQAKVIAFAGSMGDEDAKAHVKAVLAEAKAAKAELQSLKARYKKDAAAMNFLAAGGQQDKLIDESIKKLEAALSGGGHEGGKGKGGKGKGGKDDAAGGEGKGSLIGKVENGLEAIEKYKKRALRLGRKVDHTLVKVEGALRKGIQVGTKVDGGLQQAASLANKLGDFFGDDSALGHFAHQAGDMATASHERLHDALNLAKKGKSGLHKGREVFEQALGMAKEHHGQKAEKGARQAEEHIKKEVFGKVEQELVKHHKGEGHHGGKHRGHPDAAEPGGEAHPAAPHALEHAAAQHHGRGHPHAPLGHGHEAHGRGHNPRHGHGGHHSLHGHPQHAHQLEPERHERHRRHPHERHPHHERHPRQRRHPHERHPRHGHLPHPHGGGGEHGAGGEGGFDVGALISKASAAVDKFSKGVSKGIGFVEKLLHKNDHKGAGDHVQGVSSLSELARLALTEAVKVAEKDPALKKQIEALKKAYGEIKGHFHKFVGTLHGLGSDLAASGIDAKKYPELAAVDAAVEALKAKASALGDAAAKSPIPGLATLVKAGADALHKKLSALQAKYAKDPAASQLVLQIMGKLGEILQLLAGGKKGKGKGGQEAHGGEPGGGGAPAPAPKQRRRRRRRRGGRGGRHHGGQASRDIGEGGRVHVDRGANRGEADHTDGQDVDPAAMDTWLGSGEGTKNFSEVFGAFLPAEGAMPSVGNTSNGGNGGGGEHGGDGYDTPEDGEVVEHDGGEGDEDGDDEGDEEEEHGGGLLDTIGGMIGKAGKFAKGLLGKAGKFAKGLWGRAKKFGKGLLGKAGKFAKGVMGKVGGFAKGLLGKVGGFAKGLLGKLTGGDGGGILGKVFGGLHGLSDKIGGWAKIGQKWLGKGMHFAEMGMGALNKAGDIAGKVQGFAGKAEGFLDKIGLHGLAGFAGKIGGAAGWVGEKAEAGHDLLKKADDLMGAGKKGLGTVGKVAGKAGKLFGQAEKGHFGGFLKLFKASRFGDGIDGKTTPERFKGASLDDPKRLDAITLHRMEGFLGGTFSDVKIHTGKGADEVTKRYQAEAVTVKDHIFFAPGRFQPGTPEGERLIAHELTHVLQKGRPNLDVRTAEGEALASERAYGQGPQMRTLNLGRPKPDFTFSDGEGMGAATGVHTAKRTRSKGQEGGGKDEMPDGEEMMEKVSQRVYELLMEELEQAFESR